MTLCCNAWASPSGDFSHCGAQALGVRPSVVAVHGLSCPMARGIFLALGSNPGPLYWQMDSQALNHQGSPENNFYSILQQ